MDREPGHWEKKDAYCMPVLPGSLRVDPVVAALLHVTAFLELSGDGAVDPDWAVEVMEHVAHYLRQLPPERVEDLRGQLERLAAHARKKKWGADAVGFFKDFLDDYGVGDEDE